MTASISISGISINQDSEGRYSLNDLHKAAGNERRHEPKNWLNIQQTKELIEEIIKVGIPTFSGGLNTDIPVFKPIDTKRGCKGGTYVCKELVYSYAMWISAAFSLKVIRAYDALVNVVKAQESKPQTTTNDRTPLRDAINMLVGKKGLMYPEAYTLIHQRFDVGHIDELAPSQIPQAIEYVHRLVLEGELLEREQPPAPQPLFFPVPMDRDGCWLVKIACGQVASSIPVSKGKHVLSVQEFEELSRRAGNIIVPYEQLRKMGPEEVSALIASAEEHQRHWANMYGKSAICYGG